MSGKIMSDAPSPFVTADLAGLAARETVEEALVEIIPAGHACGPVEATSEQFARLEAALERKDAEQAARMPDEQAALDQMFDAYDRLRKLGWRDAIYCPKDGTSFDAIEAGSTGVHVCHYQGAWPDGSWWVEGEDDLYPSRPILYRARAAKRETPEPSSTGRLDTTENPEAKQ